MMDVMIIVGIAVIVAAVVVASGMTSEWKLYRRLRARPIMEFDDWFEKYYPGSTLDRDVVRRFYAFMAEQAFPVHPTQILPTDRLAVDLSCTDRWYEIGIDIDLWEVFAQFVTDYGVDPKRISTSCETVGQVAEDVCRLVEGRQPKKEEPMGLLGKVVCVAVIAALVGVVAWLLWSGIKALMR
jgi:hypothetical protein